MDTNNVAFKKVFLIATLLWFTFLFILVNIPDKPGGWGVGVGMLLAMPVAISWVIYPIYFIILALRYVREKGSMHVLDKVMFYILFIPIAYLGVSSFHVIYSKNVIQDLVTDSRNSWAKATEKQTGPADLVIKDIYNTSWISIKYCNESTNATVKGIAIKIEANKIISNDRGSYYPPLQAGECDVAQVAANYYKLKPGDSAKITATLDPRNEILETNKDNNTMSKDVSI